MIDGQSNFLLALGWAVLNSLWQMALLWVIYQIFSGVVKNAKASSKSAFAGFLIVTGFAWFIFTFFSILDAKGPGNAALPAGFVSADGNIQLNNWLNTTLPIASMLYLILLLFPLFYFVRNYRYVQTIRKYELGKVGVEWRIFIKNMAARMGIRKPVNIWLSGIVTSPVTIGYFKPVILLPLAAVSQLTPQQLEAVLLHELAHIRRYDYFMNLVIRFIQSILYFNPFVKALVKTVEREREKSCDELVMQFQYDPYSYASALLTLEKTNFQPRTLAMAASGKKNDLLHRIEWMLGIRKKQVISFNKLAGVMVALLCFIGINALLIISRPAAMPVASHSFAHSNSPFFFFTESNEKAKVKPEESKPVVLELKEVAMGPVTNHLESAGTDGAIHEELHKTNNQAVNAAFAPYNVAGASPYQYVSFIEPVAARELKEYQEIQVKEALEASKKVLENVQWKAVERKVADAMTSCEKNVLKCQYEKEMEKLNWDKMEAKLRVAYDMIDWPKVNESLNKALVEIKIDSLQQVYNTAMVELTDLQAQLNQNNLEAIPDSDISLKTVEVAKKNVQAAINKLIKVKTRKIIHL